MFFYPLIKMHALFKHTLPKSLFKFVWRQLEQCVFGAASAVLFCFYKHKKEMKI